MEKTKLKKVILTLFSCSVRILTAHRCTTRFVLIPASVSWAGADRHGFRGNEVGSLQPNSVPFRGHIDHSVMRNLFCFVHLIDRDGEREGDA